MRRLFLLTLVAALLPVASHAQSLSSDFTSATRYDDVSRVTGTIAPDPDGTGPLHYAATRTTYDVAGRMTRVETGELSVWQSEAVAPSAWSGFTIFSQIDTTYDAMDRKLVETLSSGGTAYGLTQYSYDAIGRLECTAQRMNPATWNSLPSSACTLATASTTYGPDRIIRTTYDPAGQVLKVTKAYGTALQQDYVTYTYSNNGKPLTVKDANGNLAGYTYDGFDRQVQWNFPDKTSIGTVSTTDYEAYGYDANGNRTSLRKRDGRTFGYTYDNLNRLTVKTVPGTCVSGYACTTPPMSAVRNVYYGYDLSGQQLYARFDSASGADTVDNAWDGFGRLASQTTAMYGVSKTVSYLYDSDGNRIRITHPDGVYFTTDYDGLDRAVAIKENGAAMIASMAYDAQGREASEARDTVTTTFGYDGAGRLASLGDDLPGGTANDITSTFAYSPASQLVSRTRSNPASYAWTGYVNVSRIYATNGLNQYTSAGSATLGYDANGNLVSDGTNSYSYDAENRLVTNSYGGSTFVYDPLGRLYGYEGTAGHSIVYDGDQRILDYTANPAVVQMRYVMGPGTDNPLIWYYGAGLTGRRSLQADERGSIVSVVDAAGTLVGTNSYDEYGIPATGNTGRYGYTGQIWDTELGMWYYKARFYSPTLGRFMQTDPIGYADQNNLYAYVGNDPMNRTDPSGKCIEDFCIGEAFALFEAVSYGIDALEAAGTLDTAASLAATTARVAIPAGAAARASRMATASRLAPYVQKAERVAAPIFGNAQRTFSGGKETTHSAISQFAASIFSRTSGVKSVFQNSQLGTITGGAVKSALRPDVAAVGKDGKVYIVEVLSPGQKAADFTAKFREALGSKLGRITFLSQ